ncbi:MAG: DinB family protein [Candidatus Sulfotelmatobacter sp.]
MKQNLMKHMSAIASLMLLLASLQTTHAQTCKQFRELSNRRATSQVIDYWVTLEEEKLVAVAEAMPADKYTFVPTDGEFKGVRTFAAQLKHLSATNFILGAAILGAVPPADAGDETGPDSLPTKAEIIRYLKDSFVYLHKAVAAIDDGNAAVANSSISPMPKGAATRLGLAVETLMHGYDHYGQLVEYLRMNGIVPPASRIERSPTT